MAKRPLERKRTVLDQRYILDHLDAVHSPDSWGRAILERVLRVFAEDEVVSVTGTFSIEKVDHGCIRVVVDIGGQEHMIHVPSPPGRF